MLDTMISHLLVALALAVIINLLMFAVAFRLKTDRLTDGSYAVTFLVLAVYGLFEQPLNLTRWLLFGMIVVWAVRIGGFLLVRIWRTGVDHRFDEMRGSLRRFGQFWLLQGVSVWVILIAALLAFNHETISLGWLSWLGGIIWLAGLLVETVADAQKARFNSEPANKGRWIDQGLWHYSRHPNYFGEILVWIGLYLAVAPSLSPTMALVGLASPLYIMLLLLFVSGIPPLERGADARWGSEAEYRTYKRRTSLLVIWPPK